MWWAFCDDSLLKGRLDQEDIYKMVVSKEELTKKRSNAKRTATSWGKHLKKGLDEDEDPNLLTDKYQKYVNAVELTLQLSNDLADNEDSDSEKAAAIEEYKDNIIESSDIIIKAYKKAQEKEANKEAVKASKVKESNIFEERNKVIEEKKRLFKLKSRPFSKSAKRLIEQAEQSNPSVQYLREVFSEVTEERAVISQLFDTVIAKTSELTELTD